jgi:AcrR family transcriptional regulator
MRKKPQQDRSRQVTAALIEATAKTIAKRGLGDITTNHIATCAGVSVGSLYQYYDSKEALVDALMDRLSEELARLIDERLAVLMDADPRTVARELLTAVFELLGRNAAYVELARNWQTLRSPRTILALERHMMEACRQYVMRHADEFRVENLPAALFVVISSTLYTVVHYLSQPRPHLSRGEVIDALSEMIASYLHSSRRDAGSR